MRPTDWEHLTEEARREAWSELPEEDKRCLRERFGGDPISAVYARADTSQVPQGVPTVAKALALAGWIELVIFSLFVLWMLAWLVWPAKRAWLLAEISWDGVIGLLALGYAGLIGALLLLAVAKIIELLTYFKRPNQ